MLPSSPFSSRREFLHAKLDALLDESDLVAENSAYGETFDDLEDFFFVKGRTFLRETFQEQLQQRVERTESQECPHCKKKHVTKTKKRNT